ncbi:MAG: hypothetical protein ACLR6J_04965 [Parabacteroides merdae]
MKGEVIRDICTDITVIYGSGRKMRASTAWKRKPGHSQLPAGSGGKRLVAHQYPRLGCIRRPALDRARYRPGIDLMDIKTRKVIKHYNLLKDSLTVKNSTVRCIKVLQEGQVYVGTDDGIYKYDFLNDRFLCMPRNFLLSQ